MRPADSSVGLALIGKVATGIAVSEATIQLFGIVKENFMSIETPTYDVHWYGPFDPEVLPRDLNENHVLYMICGTHGLYGRNVPLYIGKTERDIPRRLKEHTWIMHEPDPVKVYTACIGKFISWEKNETIDDYPPLPRELIEKVESLLIIAHQCAYNSRSKAQKSVGGQDITIFNTGRRATLFPEVSSMYWAPARND
jgi:hypothetical protein